MVHAHSLEIKMIYWKRGRRLSKSRRAGWKMEILKCMSYSKKNIFKKKTVMFHCQASFLEMSIHIQHLPGWPGAAKLDKQNRQKILGMYEIQKKTTQRYLQQPQLVTNRSPDHPFVLPPEQSIWSIQVSTFYLKIPGFHLCHVSPFQPGVPLQPWRLAIAGEWWVSLGHTERKRKHIYKQLFCWVPWIFF